MRRNETRKFAYPLLAMVFAVSYLVLAVYTVTLVNYHVTGLTLIRYGGLGYLPLAVAAVMLAAGFSSSRPLTVGVGAAALALSLFMAFAGETFINWAIMSSSLGDKIRLVSALAGTGIFENLDSLLKQEPGTVAAIVNSALQTGSVPTTGSLSATAQSVITAAKTLIQLRADTGIYLMVLISAVYTTLGWKRRPDSAVSGTPDTTGNGGSWE